MINGGRGKQNCNYVESQMHTNIADKNFGRRSRERVKWNEGVEARFVDGVVDKEDGLRGAGGYGASKGGEK
jgi:hypothetical protein